MKKLLIIFCLLLTSCCASVGDRIDDTSYSDKPIYWGYDNTVLYLSSSDDSKTPYSFSSGFEPISFYDIPWYKYREEITKIIILENREKISPISMEDWFRSMSNLNSIVGLNNIDTSHVTNMNYLFSSTKLREIDLSSFDTSSVISMRGLFSTCEELETLDLSSFDTSNVKDMFSMFFDCRNLVNINISSFDTSNVENFSNMFALCSKLEILDLSNFNTSSAIIMSDMFYSCDSLKYLDISSFNTSNVEFFNKIFGNPNEYIRNIDYSHFDFSKDRGINLTKNYDYDEYLFEVYEEFVY